MEQVHFRRSIWDYLFYLCWSVLALWFVLKVLGIINTLVWLEYWLPLGSFVLAFLMFYQSFMDKILSLTASFSKLEVNDARIELRLSHLETRLCCIEKDVAALKI